MIGSETRTQKPLMKCDWRRISEGRRIENSSNGAHHHVERLWYMHINA